YRRGQGGEPVRLAPSEHSKRPAPRTTRTQQPNASTEQGATVSSQALAMCALAEGTKPREFTFPRSMEWQTAAAQALLNSAGLRVCDCESGAELGYNKKDLTN